MTGMMMSEEGKQTDDSDDDVTGGQIQLTAQGDLHRETD